VHHEELSAGERAVLFTLLSEARKLSNAELKALIGIGLEGRKRRKLNELKLVESEKPGRAYIHVLSDAGWRWCADEFAGPGGGGTSLERSHQLVFSAFARYMAAARLSLADLVSAAPQAPGGKHVRRDAAVGDGEMTERVAAAYRALAARPGQSVPLTELRGRLADIPRAALDGALAAMFAAGRVKLIPQSSPQALTAEARASALRIGGEHKHLLSIG
jgi:hypothetical protein